MLSVVTFSLWTGDTPLAWLIALMAGNLSCCRFFNACKFATKKLILYLVCDMCVVTGVYWFALTNKNHIHFQAKMKCDYSYAILFAFYYWQWESLVMFYVVKIFCGVLLCLGTNASVIISSNVLTNLSACVRRENARSQEWDSYQGSETSETKES